MRFTRLGMDETIELRENAGKTRLARGTCCCVCHKRLDRSRRYQVRILRAGHMAPAFYYYHLRCKEEL